MLLFAPSLQDTGGVASFCKLLIENLNPDFQVEYFQIGNRPGNNNATKRVLYFIKDIFRLINVLKKGNFDFVHLNPSFRVLSLIRDSIFLTIITTLFQGNVLVLFHGWNENLANRIINSLILRNLFRKIYRKASTILVLCNQFKKQLISLGFKAEKIRVITTMYKMYPNLSMSKKYKIDKKVNILFMSRLVKSKGVYIAIDVAKKLLNNGYKDFEFIIAGDGPEYKKIKQYINETDLNTHIKTSGYITGVNKRKILGKSDIFLFPSHSEGCPIVILEAMGAGMAVISTPVAAIPDIVAHNKNGFIIESFDPDDFCLAVRKLYDDRRLLKKIQETNKQKAEARYEAKIVTKKIEYIYNSVFYEKNAEISNHV